MNCNARTVAAGRTLMLLRISTMTWGWRTARLGRYSNALEHSGMAPASIRAAGFLCRNFRGSHWITATWGGSHCTPREPANQWRSPNAGILEATVHIVPRRACAVEMKGGRLKLDLDCPASAAICVTLGNLQQAFAAARQPARAQEIHTLPLTVFLCISISSCTCCVYRCYVARPSRPPPRVSTTGLPDA